MITDLQKYLPIKSEKELIDFYIAAIKYRNNNKEKSTEIAKFIFDASHELNLNFKLSDKLSSIRFEFGSLEAPGNPEDENISPDTYDDILWDRLFQTIK